MMVFSPMARPTGRCFRNKSKRDYAAAARFWSDTYIQHSALIEPGRDGLFNFSRNTPDNRFLSR